MITLAGCAAPPLSAPAIDTRGVDANRYNDDLSECRREKERAMNENLIVWGAPIAKCMRAKGYQVLGSAS